MEQCHQTKNHSQSHAHIYSLRLSHFHTLAVHVDSVCYLTCEHKLTRTLIEQTPK